MWSTERQFRFPNPATHCTALLFIFRILFPFVRHITATICICNDLTVFRDSNSIRFTCLSKRITHTSIFWRQFTVILGRSMHSTQCLSSFPMLIYSPYCIISYCMLCFIKKILYLSHNLLQQFRFIMTPTLLSSRKRIRSRTKWVLSQQHLVPNRYELRLLGCEFQWHTVRFCRD